MTIEGSIWTFAGMTAAVGMGVVFVALFLLSMYMHYFKVLIAKFEGRAKPPAPAAAKRPAQAPALQPVPAAASKAGTEGARVAAAVAVALRLEGLRAAPGNEVAAAIAAALALHRRRSAAPPAEAPPRPASGWKLSGRMEAMSSRARRHERPAGR